MEVFGLEIFKHPVDRSLGGVDNKMLQTENKQSREYHIIARPYCFEF